MGYELQTAIPSRDLPAKPFAVLPGKWSATSLSTLGMPIGMMPLPPSPGIRSVVRQGYHPHLGPPPWKSPESTRDMTSSQS